MFNNSKAMDYYFVLKWMNIPVIHQSSLSFEDMGKVYDDLQMLDNIIKT